MKKLISNIGNWSFILLTVFFLMLLSCTDDDDGNNEPVNPSPDGKIDAATTGQNLVLKGTKVFHLG